MRNYAIHYDLPIQIVEFNGHHDTITIDIKFRKDTLFRLDQIKNLVGINEKEVEFDLLPILNDFEPIFDEIMKALIQSNDRYSNMANSIQEYCSKFPNYNIIEYGIIDNIENQEIRILDTDLVEKIILYSKRD